MTQESKRIAESRFTLSALMNPQDANPSGNVHGGVIMKMVDEAGGIAAMRHAGSTVVTAVVDSMNFLHPVYVGNLVECTAELTYVGRTSIEVYVEVIAENPYEGVRTLTSTAHLVYVAIDDNGNPRVIPKLQYETPEQIKRGEQAHARQQYRKSQKALKSGGTA